MKSDVTASQAGSRKGDKSFIEYKTRDSTCYSMAREDLLIYWYRGGSACTKVSCKGKENDPIKMDMCYIS
jgi:hypothetical protein